ncbi:conserved Plasmodium protein, unknown function [Plasmodium chabaudi chabaudi]|uniref:Uncharacterized protein n=1 Tax=Plasmodium chabaudi chabaudi TaxID=31271 RepID=A0A1D3RTK3_PLACU|nr:conserved Plasmodium protein, unknown function [Plasmodium chabaudi chabaudi]
MIYYFIFCIILLSSFNKNKYNVINVNLEKTQKGSYLDWGTFQKKTKTASRLNYGKFFFLYPHNGNKLSLKNVNNFNNIVNNDNTFKYGERYTSNESNNKTKRIYFERNGINVPNDVAMFGKTNVYYIRESIYNKNKNNLIPNEIDSDYIEELQDSESMESDQTKSSDTAMDSSTGISETNQTGNDINPDNNQTDKQNQIFSYINTERDYVTQVGNSPQVNVYERKYKADESKLNRMFENINEVNIQLLKDIKSIDDKEKIINKKVIEKVREDIKKYQETNEIMDIKGNIVKSNVGNKHKGKEDGQENNNLTNSDMDEDEKNEVLKKLYMIDKKTDKYLEEDVYFVIQSWLPDIKIDDTLIIIDNIEKHYNSFDISKYYEKFKEAKLANKSSDSNENIYNNLSNLQNYQLENIPNNINDDTEIENEHIQSYNNTYNKLNNYNLKKYSYTYTTNDNMDTKFNKNEPMPPIVIINTKKNFMVQEWESRNFKNRQKRNKSHEYTRIQRAFRPFSYIDLSDISCIYKNNLLQIKMKLSHRKYKNDVYPFFVPINKYSDDLLDFNGYKQNGDNAWSFFWHNFNYDQDTDYNFLNRNIKLNLTETKFEEVNKKKSKKIMRKLLKETKGK